MNRARAAGPGVFLLPVLLGIASVPAVRAQGPWMVRTISGATLQGEVVVGADGSVKVSAGDKVTTLATGDVLALQQPAVTERTPPLAGHVWLRSGTDLPILTAAIPAAAAGGGGLRIETGLGPAITLSPAHLAALRLLRAGADLSAFESERRSPGSSQDYLFVVRDGKVQRFSVLVTGLRDGKVAFELRGESYDPPLDDLAALVFGSLTGFAPDPQPGPRANLRLDTGERLCGRLVSLAGDAVVRLDEGVELTVPRARLREIAVVSDRLAWLSDLKPTVEQTPAFDRVWPWTVDRSPAGGAIRLGGRVRERGLVVLPRIRLTYDLRGNYDVFAATIGIEDRGGPQANAVFRVWADGRLLHESTGFTCGMTPVDLELPLDKAQHLTIEADFGKNYDLGDLCVFADARVFKR